MAVVINEFEVVAEPPPAPRAASPEPEAPRATPPRPEAMGGALRHLARRAARLAAD